MKDQFARAMLAFGDAMSAVFGPRIAAMLDRQAEAAAEPDRGRLVAAAGEYRAAAGRAWERINGREEARRG